MTVEMTVRRFERGDATATEIEDVAREVIRELREPRIRRRLGARALGTEKASERED